MLKLWILLIVYLVVGAIATVVYVRRSEKAGNSPFVFLAYTPIGMILVLLFWPLFVMVMAMELTFPQEKHAEKLSVEPIIERGAQGIAETKMRPSGKVRFGDRVADAQSLSGSLEPGAQVEVVSVEMNLYKVEKSK